MRTAPCGCNEEVGTVENVERLSFEPQAHAFGEFEVLCDSHVGIPSAGSYKSVAPEIPGASQTRSRKHGQV